MQTLVGLSPRSSRHSGVSRSDSGAFSELMADWRLWQSVHAQLTRDVYVSSVLALHSAPVSRPQLLRKNTWLFKLLHVPPRLKTSVCCCRKSWWWDRRDRNHSVKPNQWAKRLKHTADMRASDNSLWVCHYEGTIHITSVIWCNEILKLVLCGFGWVEQRGRCWWWSHLWESQVWVKRWKFASFEVLLCFSLDLETYFSQQLEADVGRWRYKTKHLAMCQCLQMSQQVKILA